MAQKKAEGFPPLSETFLPAGQGDVLEIGRTLELSWLQGEPAPGLDRAVPPDAPGCGDFWLAYEEVFPKRTHRLCGKAAGETKHHGVASLYAAYPPQEARCLAERLEIYLSLKQGAG